MLVLTAVTLVSLVCTSKAAVVLLNPKLANMDDGFLELRPNGTVILRSAINNNSSNIWQEAIIFKTILNAIRLMPPQAQNTFNDLRQTIYGESVEHKFPPFLERVIQRIQTYFSVYRYTDTSAPVPVRVDNNATITTTTTARTMKTVLPLLSLTPNKDDSNGPYRNKSTLPNMNKLKTTPPQSKSASTTTAIKPETLYNKPEENEFIEMKNRKSFENKKS